MGIISGRCQGHEKSNGIFLLITFYLRISELLVALHYTAADDEMKQQHMIDVEQSTQLTLSYCNNPSPNGGPGSESGTEERAGRSPRHKTRPQQPRRRWRQKQQQRQRCVLRRRIGRLQGEQFRLLDIILQNVLLTGKVGGSGSGRAHSV